MQFSSILPWCDTVSSFAGIGKISAYERWWAFPAVSLAFCNLSNKPETLSNYPDDLNLIERFTVLLYSRACLFKSTVNQTRQSGTRQYTTYPGCIATAHKASSISGGSCLGTGNIQDLPNPSDWGWQNIGDGWAPLWSTLPEAAKVCHELIHC